LHNVLIVEDDLIQLKTLSNIIKQLGDDYHVYRASSIEEALRISEQEVINLFYIDINIKNESGLKFALEIRKKEKYRLTWIVFVTIYKEYMLAAFKKIHCYDYILKPYDIESIEKTTKLLMEESQAQVAATEVNEKFIIVDVKKIQVKIFIDEIIFVEVFIRTSIIHTINGSFTIDYLSLKKLHGMINDKNILQSHRSYLVNLKYINKIEKTSDKTACKIYFNNTKETALLGKSYRRDIMDRFSNVFGGDIDE
jgi:DNA-binding LytR/AlgR family response regulator